MSQFRIKPASPSDEKIIARIIKRVLEHTEKITASETFIDVLLEEGRATDIALSMIAVHTGVCPLDLERMLEEDISSVCHDVYGIDRYIDKNTGELREHFWPRCAKKQ